MLDADEDEHDTEDRRRQQGEEVGGRPAEADARHDEAGADHDPHGARAGPETVVGGHAAGAMAQRRGPGQAGDDVGDAERQGEPGGRHPCTALAEIVPGRIGGGNDGVAEGKGDLGEDEEEEGPGEIAGIGKRQRKGDRRHGEAPEHVDRAEEEARDEPEGEQHEGGRDAAAGGEDEEQGTAGDAEEESDRDLAPTEGQDHLFPAPQELGIEHHLRAVGDEQQPDHGERRAAAAQAMRRVSSLRTSGKAMAS